MDLLSDPWVPVRDSNGTAASHLLRYEEVLCAEGDWRLSLPRDDLELACLQLLVCMTQVMFLPPSPAELRSRIRKPLTSSEFSTGTDPFRAWFDLDHPEQPFMQARGVKGEWTSMQKLLPGLPERTSTSASAHCFFNGTTELEQVGGPVAAIALFNLASNSPSFGGGFKGSLRGGSPITTLVMAASLRESVWRNVLSLDHVRRRIPWYEPGLEQDQPTWVRPIARGSTIHPHEIGLARGLFWQPSRLELVRAAKSERCDVLGETCSDAYSGFRKEKFTFTVDGLWPHPHGAMVASHKKEALTWRFASFTTTAPAWTMLSEFVVPRGVQGSDAREGAAPASPVIQAAEFDEDQPLHLAIGGYRTDQASIEQRRHELVSVAQGWNDPTVRGRLEQLVRLGIEAKTALHKRLDEASKGRKGMKGLEAQLGKLAEQRFYSRSERLMHETIRDRSTFRDWQSSRTRFATSLTDLCREIFQELTAPYARKPELIPVIAWVRRALNGDIRRLIMETTP